MLTLGFFWSSHVVHAQFSDLELRQIDSLKNVAENVSNHDTTRINALFDWDNLIYNYDVALDKELNQRIVEICSKNQREHPKSPNKNFFIEFEASGLNNLGIITDNQGNYDEAVEFYQRSYDLNSRIPDTAGMANAMNNIALIYDKKSEFTESIPYYLKSLSLRIASGEKSINSVKVLNNISMAYENIGKLDSALLFNKQAIDLARGLNIARILSEAYCNRTIIYNDEHFYSEALQELDSALKYGLISDDIAQLGFVYTIYGNIYHSLDSFQLCLSYYRKALDARLTASVTLDVGSSYGNLAVAHKELANYDTALFYFDVAQQYAEKYQEQHALAGILSNEGDIYFEKGDYQKAKEYNEKAYKLIVPTGYLEFHEIICLRLFRVYKKLNQTEKALKYHEEYISIRDTNQRIENKQAIIHMQIKTRYEDQAKLDSLQSADQLTLYDQQIKNERLKKELWGAGFILFIVIALAYYLWSRARQKNKLVQVELDSEMKVVNALMEGQEMEQLRVAQELHDGICSSLLATEFILKSNNPDEALKMIKTVVRDVRNLSHQIIPPDFAMYDLAELINQFVDAIGMQSTLKINRNYIGDFSKISKETKIALFRVTQESLTNVIKYAQATKVSIQLISEANELTLMIEDDGIGFNLEKKNAGIGLTNIAKRISNIGGKLNIDTSPGHGTSIIIQVGV